MMSIVQSVHISFTVCAKCPIHKSFAKSQCIKGSQMRKYLNQIVSHFQPLNLVILKPLCSILTFLSPQFERVCIRFWHHSSFYCFPTWLWNICWIKWQKVMEDLSFETKGIGTLCIWHHSVFGQDMVEANLHFSSTICVKQCWQVLAKWSSDIGMMYLEGYSPPYHSSEKSGQRVIMYHCVQCGGRQSVKGCNATSCHNFVNCELPKWRLIVE